MNEIRALEKWIRENCMTPENRHANGELNWNNIEADIIMTLEGSDVADPLPPLPFKPTYEDIDAAFDLMDDEPCSDILTLNDRKGV